MAEQDAHLSSLTHRPSAAPTLNTSPDALQIPDQPSPDDPHRSQSHSRVKRISTTIEKTVDKLTRSTNAKSGSPTPTSTSPRRVFSLSRKSRHNPSASADNSGVPTNLASYPHVSLTALKAKDRPQGAHWS